MEEQDISELANYIVGEIVREDFFYAMREYGGFKIKTTANKIIEWWVDV